MEELKEMPIEIASLSRVKHQKWNKGEKANICVCANFNAGWCKEIKCEECGKRCYYSEGKDNEDLKKENIKKICLDCCLTKYSKCMPIEQVKFLEMLKNMQ